MVNGELQNNGISFFNGVSCAGRKFYEVHTCVLYIRGQLTSTGQQAKLKR